MKAFPFFFLLCVTCFILSCKQQQSADIKTVLFDCDEKTVPFDYDEKMLKLMIFKGTLNDSISLNVMFDTGGNSNHILLSDSLAGLLADTMVNLQIGVYKSSVPIFAIDRNNHAFRYFDAIIGWQFFKDKIIEISYQHKYIRELDTIPVSTDFFPIKMEAINKVRIPIKIFVQGKCIEEDFSIDTGFNGDIMLGKYFLDKNKIDLTGAYIGASQTIAGPLSGGSIPGDSIELGKFVLPETRIGFSTTNVGMHNRLVGNKVFEHFTVILDLKNFYLYLKPNE